MLKGDEAEGAERGWPQSVQGFRLVFLLYCCVLEPAIYSAKVYDSLQRIVYVCLDLENEFCSL